MNKAIALLILVAASQAFAGGVSLQDNYRGVSPVDTTGNEVTLKLTDQTNGTLRIGFAEHKVELKLDTSSLVTESVFEVHSYGKVIAKLVTEPPCTAAMKAVLILPSGLNIPLEATP